MSDIRCWISSYRESRDRGRGGSVGDDRNRQTVKQKSFHLRPGKEPFLRGKQLGHRLTLTSFRTIEREFGMQPPKEHSEGQHQQEYRRCGMPSCAVRLEQWTGPGRISACSG